MKPFYSMDFRSYQLTDAINHSTLERMLPTAAHCKWALDHPDKGEGAVHLRLGTAIHSMVLEGKKDEAFAKSVAVRPEGMNFRTKEGRAWRDEQIANGLTILTQDEFGALTAGVSNTLADPVCRQALEDGEPEVSLLWKHHDGETLLKARLDWVPNGMGCIVDLKVVSDASPEGFSRAVWEYGWHRKAAWYLDGWNAVNPDDQRTFFVWIAIEKRPPYLPALYQCHPLDIALGRQQNEQMLTDFLRARRTGIWPGYTALCSTQTGIPFVDLGRYTRRVKR